jgi:hypothetical protein
VMAWLFTSPSRCLGEIFVDKQEYQEAKVVACPLPKCNHAWCKSCSQAIEFAGPLHSCDGSSELDHLMGQRGWKYCPGMLSVLVNGISAQITSRLQNSHREDEWVQPHDCQSLFVGSVMVLTCFSIVHDSRMQHVREGLLLHS